MCFVAPVVYIACTWLQINAGCREQRQGQKLPCPSPRVSSPSSCPNLSLPVSAHFPLTNCPAALTGQVNIHCFPPRRSPARAANGSGRPRDRTRGVRARTLWELPSNQAASDPPLQVFEAAGGPAGTRRARVRRSVRRDLHP